MREFLQTTVGKALAVLAVIGVTITVVVTVSDDGSSNVTVTLGVPAQQRADVPNEITVPKAAVEAAEETEAGHHDKLKSELPPGVPPEQLEAAQDQQDRLAASDQLPIVTPLAAPSQRGCRSRFVRNYSSRRGVRPRLFVVHYTVSPNRPGRSDVDGITALFNRPAFAASSHYVIDRDGNCNYIVRESDKAWTQAAGNPVSVSVEVINTGRESPFLKAAGYRKLGIVAADFARRWHVPLRIGKVSGCRVVRSGIVMHKDFGLCGGGHVDVTPFRLAPVVSAARKARAASKRAQARRRCAKRSTAASRKRCLRKA